jgi:prepilin-type N-terminal cleavage/methylation domain-containing protein
MTLTRRAFTLVELLVVITIIGILIALLLPAIYGGIANARKLECADRMRQVTIATSGYAIQHGHYPGFFNRLGDRAAPWPVVVAKNLGRVDIFDAWSDPSLADAELPRVVLDVFKCPSNPPAMATVPQLSFVVNAGASSAVAQSPANGVFLDRTLGAAAPMLTPAGIVDGAANTMLFSENVQATQWHVLEKNVMGFVWHPTTAPASEMLINRGLELPLSENTARPSSRHYGGVNATYCDDHVKFLSQNIDYKVYMQLMTSNAKQSDMPAEWKDYHLNAADMN